MGGEKKTRRRNRRRRVLRRPRLRARARAAVARYRRRPEGGPDGGGGRRRRRAERAFFSNLLPNLLRPSVARRRAPNPAGPYARFEGDAAPEAGSHRAPADHIELAMTGPDAARRAVSISPGTGVGAYVLPNWRAVPLLDQSVRGGRERDATDAPNSARARRRDSRAERSRRRDPRGEGRRRGRRRRPLRAARARRARVGRGPREPE